jgi:hypothetical protein
VATAWRGKTALMEAGISPPPEEAGPGYTGAAVAGAVLAVLFFPFISLIAALLLQGGQTDSRKKAQLRTWAWASVGWMVLWGIVVVLLSSVGSRSAGSSNHSGVCVGGPKVGATGTQVPGSTTKFVEPCAISGSQTVTFP